MNLENGSIIIKQTSTEVHPYYQQEIQSKINILKSLSKSNIQAQNAFGIVFMDPLINNEANAVVVAHELIHILGVNHQESVTTTRDILENQTCLKTGKNSSNQISFKLYYFRGSKLTYIQSAQ